MPRPDPVPGAEVRRTTVGYFPDRWEIDYGNVIIERDGDITEPPKPRKSGDPFVPGLYVVRSIATRHAPFGQTTRPNGRTGPVLHRVRQVTFKWVGYDYDRQHPHMMCDWWCKSMSHNAMLLLPAQVVGRHVCAKCEAYAVAFGEEPSGLTLRRPREYPRNGDR